MANLERSKSNLFSSSLRDFFESDDFFGGRFPSFSKFESSLIPSANISETANEFLVELAAPGLKKEDFNIDIENNIVRVSVEKSDEKEETDKDFCRKEFSYQSFSRGFRLPENVRHEDVTAKYADGLLKLVIPKRVNNKEADKKRIAVD